MNDIIPFLMFQDGKAEAAMKFYTSVFKDSAITSIDRYGAGEAGIEGTVRQATFTIRGQAFMCIDSNVKHQFTFTPSFSIFVTCYSEKELEDLFKALGEGGQTLMPLDNYGFSKRFGWLNDRFGVSWQLNLPE